MPFADYLRAAVLEPLGMAARFDGRPGVGHPRLARRPARVRARAARADAGRDGDARRGDVRPVPGPRRRAPGLRPPGAERLGPRLRASRREVAALDGLAQLAADVRPLRPQRHLPLGRPRRRARARLPDRPRLRRLGEDRLAGALRRGRWPRASNTVLQARKASARLGPDTCLCWPWLVAAAGPCRPRPTTASLAGGWTAQADRARRSRSSRPISPASTSPGRPTIGPSSATATRSARPPSRSPPRRTPRGREARRRRRLRRRAGGCLPRRRGAGRTAASGSSSPAPPSRARTRSRSTSSAAAAR